MPKLVREIDSIFNLDEELLDSGGGGCCLGAISGVAEGLSVIPVPTSQEIIDASNQKLEAIENLTKRIYASVQDDNITPEDFILLSKIIKNRKLSLENYPGLGVAMLNRVGLLSLKTDNTPREALMIERSLQFLSDASEPEICPSQLNRLSMIGTHSFEDYGPIILENIN